jgi:hypothetical protein
MKLGVVIAILGLLYLFYPSYELLTRSLDDQKWRAGDTYWSLSRCRAGGRALGDAEWRCRQNNPWHQLFRTGTRYDPDIHDSQRALELD